MENVKTSLKILYCFMIIAGLSQVCAAAEIPWEHCIFWNRLDSQTNVENSDLGLDGLFTAGSFASGIFSNNAYEADQYSALGVTFPKDVIPLQRGTIEFWAKLNNYSGDTGWGAHPYLIRAVDSTGASYSIHLNGNDGTSGGGLCANAGYGNNTSSGWAGEWSYEQILGSDVAAWHHYALVWDNDGIAGVSDGTKKVAIFLNGRLKSSRWYGSTGPTALVDGVLGLVDAQGWTSGRSVTIDNIRTWDVALTDFSCRYFEIQNGEEIPEPATIALLGLGCFILRRRRK